MSSTKLLRAFLLLLAFIAGACTFLQGQGIITDRNILYNKRPAISSPEAAAIEKFVEFPAANYTGVPDISIPIYTVKAKGATIPIALSYHAGGIKVDEVSSNVGIGWALMAGGSISILANGIRDEHSRFPLEDTFNFNKIKTLDFQTSYLGGILDCDVALIYYNPVNEVFANDPYQLYAGDDIDFLRNVVQYTADSEPDIYTFNFLGRTGKFFQDESGVFRTIPYSNLRIERILVSDLPAGYKITDENGIIYEFKAEDGSTETSVAGSDIYHPVTRYNTSYFLTKIRTTEGDQIDFYYSGFSHTYALQDIFYRSKTSTLSDCWELNQSGDLFSSYNTTSSLTVGTQRIDSIKSSDGTLIRFLYSSSDRTDMPDTKSLDTIQVCDYLFDRRVLNQFILGHNYSTGRLTLTSVTEKGKPASTFNYNGNLPDRLSYSIDHYGFYNARSNSTLLPQDEYMEFWAGADRSIDTNYTQTGILTKIVHPTGGSTEFIYEPNEYYVPDTTTIYPKVIGDYIASFPNQTVYSDTMTITSASRKIRMIYNNSYDGTQIHNDYCIIKLSGPGYYQEFFDTSNLVQQPLTLAPGQYVLSIENVGSTYSADAALIWFEETKVPPHNEIGGGVRIKEIRKADSVAASLLVRRFEYKQSGTDLSSGVVNFPPNYIEYKDQTIKKQGDVNYFTSPCTSQYCQFVSQSSNCASPIAPGNGSLVLYKEVTTYLKDKTESGYSNCRYNISETGFNTGIPSFPYAPNIRFDWTDGLLLEQKDYGYVKGQMKLLKKSANTYNYLHFNPAVDTTILHKTYGAKIATQDPPFVCWSPCVNFMGFTSFSPMSFGVQQYKYYSSWHRLERTEDTIYSIEGNDYLAKTINQLYQDAPYTQVSTITTLDSKGDTVKKKLQYPYHYAGTAVYDSMVARNMINPTVQETGFRNSTELTKVKTNYALWQSNTFILPSTIQASFRGNTLDTEMSFASYDNSSSLLEFTAKDGVPKSFIWDYYSRYPIAEGIGASSASIAYTSFEADGKGGWSFSGSSSVDATAPTGNKCYNTTSSNITKGSLTSATYIVSYWGKNGSVSVNSNGPDRSGKIIGDWRYYEHEVTGTSITISGTKYIDELRLYPKGSMLKTYTYTPLIGMTTQCDINNRISYYEYDDLGRLSLIRDEDRNILKKFCYNYAGQQEDCSCGGGVANWQNTDTLRCQVNGSSENTGYVEMKQRDMNPCSPTYFQTQWVVSGTDSTTCPPPASVTITYNNIGSIPSHKVEYYNTSTFQTYIFNIPSSGSGTLGTVPPGSYTVAVVKVGGGIPTLILAGTGCQYQSGAGTVMFYNVNVSSCHHLTLDLDLM